MSFKFLIWIVLMFPISILAQSIHIPNVLHQKTISLNGNWHYIMDPYQTGYFNYRYEPYDQADPTHHSAFYNDYHTDDKMALVEYDFDQSPTLNVPGDWNSQDDKLLYYEGTVWYRKLFDYTKSKTGQRIFVYFGAVNYIAEVYLNGVKLGTHEGGFTPFSFEITSILKENHNTLVVKVNNNRIKEGIPTLNTDWWNYGGITRDVLLVEVPPVYIKQYKIQLKKNQPNILSGYLEMDGLQQPVEVSIDIPELNIKHKIQVSNQTQIPFEIKVNNLKYWSPENPKRYEVNIQTPYEKLTDLIGFRSIQTKGKELLLNGHKLLLKGISIHEENPLRKGRAVNESDARMLLEWAKQLGCNYIRLAHYPHNEYMIQLAEEMGFLIWAEIPVYWTVSFESNDTYQKAENQLIELISRDQNRAAIIFWSMANETPPSTPRNIFIKKLIDKARSLDDTRLISAALEKHTINGIQVVDDPLGEWLDVVAFNQYTGWYGGSLEEAPEARWDIRYDKPVIISEFGGGAVFGLHGSIKERWTEEYQVYLYEQNLKMIEKIPGISGMSPWILVDFRSPKRVLPNIQDGWNRKGLISSNGEKKMAYFTLQTFYKIWH